MESRDMFLYHITDTLRHKEAVMKCFNYFLKNESTSDISLLNIIRGVLDEHDPAEVMNSDDEIFKEILINTYDRYTCKGHNEDDILKEIGKRALYHDISKICGEEYEEYSNIVWRFDGLKYGTPEHKEVANLLDSAFMKYHVPSNDHHPEHFENGLAGMDLLQFMEMIIDWCAASSCRGFKLNVAQSVERCQTKLGLRDAGIRVVIENINLILPPDMIEPITSIK